MDMTAIDVRIKTLMRLKHLTHDEAKHLLLETNWDVDKARDLYTQRTSGQPLPLSSHSGRINDGSGVTLVQVNRSSQMFPNEAEPPSKTSSSDSEPLPKSNAPDSVDTDIIDAPPGPRLHRGMSKATINLPIVMIARDILQKDAAAASMAMDRRDEDDANSFIQTTEFTFVLPDLMRYPEDFKAFLYKDLIDMATLVSLEQGGHLNWWADVGACQRLLPMVTSGDGNCLLHAASLGMWGFHDRQLLLRKLLSDALTHSPASEAFKRRWRYQQTMVNRFCNLVLSEKEWEDDWRFLIQLSSAQPRTSASKRSTDPLSRNERSFAGQSLESEPVYESLEELHVFVLAYVLRRPIIVVAKTMLQDVNGEALAPIPFGGIYLPLEWNAHQCHCAPLLLTYDLSHFCALVSMEASPGGAGDVNLQLPDAIPLVDPNLDLLPIHFAIDPGPDYDFSRGCDLSLSDDQKMSLVRRYFVVEQVPIPQRLDQDFLPETSLSSGVLKMELTKSDSEESSGSGKDRNVFEDFDRRTLPKPMKFITKSIDKIKNITKINKSGKLERKSSIGFATQSTRKSSIAAEMLEDQNFVICARLRLRKTGYQDELVSNYMATMKEKFGNEQVRRQKQHAEIVRVSLEMMSHHQKNYDSFGRANERPGPAFNRVQADAPRGGQRDSRAPPSYADTALLRQNTIVTAGKSKFYTAASEEQCPALDCTAPKIFADADPKLRKYNKIDTLALQSVQEGDHGSTGVPVSLGKRDLINWGTMPPPGGAKLTLDDAPRRLNAISNRMASDRYSADPGVFRSLRDAPTNAPEKSSTLRPTTYVGSGPKESDQGSVRRYAGASVSDPGNQSAAVDPLFREPNRENGVRLKEAEQRLCRTDGCNFYGTYDTDFLCSQCFKSEQTFRPCLNASCSLEGRPSMENLCALCYQRKCYNKQVEYPIAKTKF